MSNTCPQTNLPFHLLCSLQFGSFIWCQGPELPPKRHWLCCSSGNSGIWVKSGSLMLPKPLLLGCPNCSGWVWRLGTKEGTRTQSPTSCQFLSSILKKLYPYWSHEVSQKSYFLYFFLSSLIFFKPSFTWCPNPKHLSFWLLISILSKHTKTTSQQITNLSPQNKTNTKETQRNCLKWIGICMQEFRHQISVLREGHSSASPRTKSGYFLFIYVTMTYSSDPPLLQKSNFMPQINWSFSFREETAHRNNCWSIVWLNRWVY